MAAEQTWTVRRVLEWTAGFFTRKSVDSPRLAAELLLSYVLGVPRIKLYTDYERPLTEKELADYRSLVQRAGEHEPIAYLTGRAHFFSLEFEVGPGVLIPRPDTETLVEQVIQFCRHQPGMETPRILDLCTGSACIAAALAANLKTATVIATDISPVAVEMAKKNIARLNLADRVTVELGDLFEPVKQSVDPQPFHLIVSNPPYIPTAQVSQLDRSVKDFEPLAALDGGRDGLAAHRRILAEAPERLLPTGRIYLEIGFDQGEAARELVAGCEALDDVRVIRDLGGKDRVVTARKKG